METTLGKAHTVSPFASIYQKYNFSSAPSKLEEEKKQELVTEEKKDEIKNETKKI